MWRFILPSPCTAQYNFFFSSRRRHTRWPRDWSSDVCSSDLVEPEEDIERVAAVRQALGPKAKLMVDVNCAWSPSFAIEMGQALEPYKLYWIEEPVATDDIDGSARVADALGTPIAGYETEIGLYGFRELITRGAVDIVQPDIAWA